ncbi:hypothetical protein [Clostridium sp. AF32-12BH]|uniref:hypothetical protein n=1 Tax=Clostridium sp. AF32-12BH TaxID=2292006 RepID=UPI000E5032FC|nr:hypothetical protein [Clostridium sp. AF32-12BH]RHP47007.1 hypothetical protein DWZ40_08875 [Clostridium sp. AF32-12BH]
MAYVICNDKEQYIAHDPIKMIYYVADNIEEAKKWDKIVKANNYARSMPKQFKGYNFAVKYVVQQEHQISGISHKENLPYTIPEKMEELLALSEELDSRRLYLLQEIHNVELEIVDIEHAAEFYNLNAAQGYKIYKMLHDSRIKRREMKDELEQIKYLQSAHLVRKELNTAKRSISGMKNRKYGARINKELFGV